VLQILLVDLGTDLLPGLALGGERPEPGTMSQPPRGRGQHIVTGGLLLRALGVLGLLAALLSLSGYFAFQWDATGKLGSYVDQGPLYRQATTITFAGIVACQIGNALACRSERDSILRLGPWSNRPLLWAIGAEVLLLAAVIAAPPLRHMFDLEPIEPRYWPVLALFAPLFLLTEELRKAAARRLRQTPRHESPAGALTGG
jgi:Ca2+-transporting ATPase